MIDTTWADVVAIAGSLVTFLWIPLAAGSTHLSTAVRVLRQRLRPSRPNHRPASSLTRIQA